ncbi:energy transducer TonB [Ancylomarina sp. YFZ004]
MIENIDKGELHLGNLIVQTIPSNVIIRIPKLKLYGEKKQDSIVLEDIYSGEYKLIFTSNNSRFKCKINVLEGKTMHLLINVKKKEYDIKEIIYKAHLSDQTEMKPTKVLTVADEMPQFKGGVLECQKWICHHLRYPIKAQKEGVVGKVYVGFVINEEGKVVNVKVVKPVHPLLDAEAKRVVERMPKWKPGKHEGKFVRISYTFPINFQLSN